MFDGKEKKFNGRGGKASLGEDAVEVLITCRKYYLV